MQRSSSNKNKKSKKLALGSENVATTPASEIKSPENTKADKGKQEASYDEIAIHLIRTSGVFDADLYLSLNSDLQGSGIDAASHYFFHGWKEGRTASHLFDSQWYLKQNLDVAQSGMNPLVHYLHYGENEGRSPCPYFDPVFYKNQFPQKIRSSSMLAAYINEEWRHAAPNEFFDGEFYLSIHQDVAASGNPPLVHYTQQGWREGREVSPRYSLEKYRLQLEKKNITNEDPLRYFLTTGRDQGDILPATGTRAPSSLHRSGSSLQMEIEKNQRPGPFFEDKLLGIAGKKTALKARLFAFYLPQFYPFEQNNTWWGPGFTEWRNVTRALPRFEGHQQPHLPRELGFYDLRNIDTLRQQVEMAKASGIAGFCFYYYWFNGTRLLDRPLDMFLSNPDLEISFSLMWANENWTRRWDGLENDILMGQDYHDSDDDALIADLAKYFADPRYERVDGRPLFIIYRPGIIPKFVERLEKWREIFREKHAMNPMILMVLGFGDFDPVVYNVDGAIEFPPHKLAEGLHPVNSSLNIIDEDFQGHYLQYDDLVASSVSVPAPSYDLIRTLVPAWDNEARKPSRGMGFVEANPEKYEYWLRQLVSYAQSHPFKKKTPYVFVNAWNEWAEGAHLEPDMYHGTAYLNATYRALTGIKKKQSASKSILLIGHDAYKHGAQLLTLNIMRTLKQDFGLDPILILLEGGPLIERYEELGQVFVIGGSGRHVGDVLDELLPKFPIRTAICNTVVTGSITSHLSDRGFQVVSLVHELSQLITERNLEPSAEAIAKHADTIIFASQFVQSSFEKITGPLGEKAIIQPQGIYQHLEFEPTRRNEIRQKLNLSSESKIVLNMGFGDLRKGFDLYVSVAKQVINSNPDYHFVWLGNLQGDLKHWLQIDLLVAPLAGHFHILPFDDDVGSYLNGADVYALTSREDPFPSVVLEALACGVPVVGFEGGGGYGDAIQREPFNGALVPMGDIGAMSAVILDLLKNPNYKDAEMRSEKALATYNWKDYVFGLLQILTPDLKKVSVVVPNFNYSHHLAERLTSIFEQQYPIYELIILDDKSTDDSILVIGELLKTSNRNAQVIVNSENSGSVFKQWEKGAKLAKGEFLWISEADDACTPTFIRDLTAKITKKTSIAFCDSLQVDSANQSLGGSYDFYFRDLPQNPMVATFKMDGREFVQATLSIKNVILNVSAVMFDRKALITVFDDYMDEICSYKMAGDWFIYSTLLSKVDSEVVYIHKPNNVHRRHAASVTHALARRRHIEEISRVQSVVSKKIKLSRNVAKAAETYLLEVSQQFEIEEKGLI